MFLHVYDKMYIYIEKKTIKSSHCKLPFQCECHHIIYEEVMRETNCTVLRPINETVRVTKNCRCSDDGSFTHTMRSLLYISAAASCAMSASSLIPSDNFPNTSAFVCIPCNNFNKKLLNMPAISHEKRSGLQCLRL